MTLSTAIRTVSPLPSLLLSSHLFMKYLCFVSFCTHSHLKALAHVRPKDGRNLTTSLQRWILLNNLSFEASLSDMSSRATVCSTLSLPGQCSSPSLCHPHRLCDCLKKDQIYFIWSKLQDRRTPACFTRHYPPGVCLASDPCNPLLMEK